MTRLKDLLTVLAFSIALLPMSAAAVPADTAGTPEAAVKAELLKDLTSESVEAQERAALRIREYAYTQRYNDALFRDLVTPLHDIVVEGRTEHVRLMAVSALSAIGSDVAMIGLQVEKDELASERLRKATEAAFDRYAAKHTEGTRRTQLGE